ncbi:MAG: hypothetical protein M0Z40_08310 [Actinomycetota bacterium]|nr:hypothetical protein [Actinomycetota bacterium]
MAFDATGPEGHGNAWLGAMPVSARTTAIVGMVGHASCPAVTGLFPLMAGLQANHGVLARTWEVGRLAPRAPAGGMIG